MPQVVENFSATTKKDNATTANWNTALGKLTLGFLGFGNGGAGGNTDLTINNGETVNLALNTDHQYRNITINQGGTLTTNSSSGSVLHLRCSGDFVCNGVINLTNILPAGQRTDSVTIDGVGYSSPSVANGGSGGATGMGYGSPGGQGYGFGGGGAGGFAGWNYGGVGGLAGGGGATGGASAGGGGGAVNAANNNTYNGNGGGANSGGGSGAANSGSAGGGNVTSGAGGSAFGGGASNASNNGQPGSVGGGGGGGGIAGKAGIHLVVKAKTITIGATASINTSGTSGGNGGGGTDGQQSHIGHYLTEGGSGGGGGGGGHAGSVNLIYSDTLSNSGTITKNGGSGGSGGGGSGGFWGDGGTGGFSPQSAAGGGGSSGSAGSTTNTSTVTYDVTKNVGLTIGLDSATQNITKATLNKTDNVPAGMSIAYELSNDGGSHWTTVTPGTELTFGYTGTDLRARITLTGSGTASTPYVDDITIDYTVVPITLSLSDTISLADNQAKTFGKSLADSLSLTDSLTYFKGIIILINDTINLVDGIVKNFRKNISDSISLTDNIVVRFIGKSVKMMIDFVKDKIIGEVHDGE